MLSAWGFVFGEGGKERGRYREVEQDEGIFDHAILSCAGKMEESVRVWATCAHIGKRTWEEICVYGYFFA